jgi:hypothetical protein
VAAAAAMAAPDLELTFMTILQMGLARCIRSRPRSWPTNLHLIKSYVRDFLWLWDQRYFLS